MIYAGPTLAGRNTSLAAFARASPPVRASAEFAFAGDHVRAAVDRRRSYGAAAMGRVESVARGRARLVGCQVRRAETLNPGQRSPFRTLIGAQAAVDAAQQRLLPEASYNAAARESVAVVAHHGGFAPATTGALALFDAVGSPWIGRDAQGAVPELGVSAPGYEDVAGRSTSL
ncbi:hypothetical protein [Nannocystis exedens]|nr:hypothetical protein [Nannocystis exedens]